MMHPYSTPSNGSCGRVGAQARLPLAPPPVIVAVPPHDPAKAPKLAKACRRLLDALESGHAFTLAGVAELGGRRYSARIGELRAAGYVVLGPRPWMRPDGTMERRTVPMFAGRECYRLERGR